MMARLYPPVTEEALPAFCLTYDDKGQKLNATLKISFNLNKAVASSEVMGMALRLRTVSTDKYVIDENIKENDELGKTEGYAIAYDLKDGSCTFTLTNQYNPERMEFIKVGQYYKAQIAFIGKDDEIGYWSTVSTIKCIARPTVRIGNFKDDDVNVFMNEFIGTYKQDTTTGDSSEKAYSYRFQLFQTDQETLVEDTGILLHNSINDTKANESEDKYYCFQELDQDKIYYLQYSVVTINGYEASSPLYQIINVGSIDPTENIGLLASVGNEDYYSSELEWSPQEEGLVKLQIIFNKYADREGRKKLMGNFVITRSSSRDNYATWQEVARVRFNEDIPQLKPIYDYTVEQGVRYKYAVQQYNRHGFYSNKIYCYERDKNLNIKMINNAPKQREVIVDFEDMFLYDGKKQLKIRFSPKVNSFKNDLQEQKMDTIGSKYPFIFRNGNVCYKEFPISGLISFQQDNASFFIDNNDYYQMDLERFDIPADFRQNRYGVKYDYVKFTKSRIEETDLPLYYQEVKTRIINNESSHHENLNNFGETKTEEYIEYIKIKSTGEALTIRNGEGKDLYSLVCTSLSSKEVDKNYSDIYRNQTYNKTDLIGKNMASERYFKLTVLEWLTNGEPKLFRSSAEGNYVVRLMNVSLTPKNELGRMLHEFSCTAYEIAGTDFFTLKELGLLNINTAFLEEYQWSSLNVIDIFQPDNFNITTNAYNVDLGNKKVYGFSCTGFEPGDIISFITEKSSDPLDIVIGQAGSYIYEGPDTVISLKIIPLYNRGPFSRDIQLKTRGFNYQKFDLITAIGIHTQMSQQIIGKHDNFFKKVIVGDPGFETANNVYLTEDFEQILGNQVNKDTFDENIGKWYMKDDSKNIYVKTESERDYIENRPYFIRKPAGEKVITYDLIHLHAKRREVIPIFINTPSNTAGYLLGQVSKDAKIFSLTPFGTGYVHYRSVSKDINFSSLYGNLTEDERVEARSVNNLVDFFIKSCKTDLFCVFEVYVPVKRNNISEWKPYYEAYEDQTYSGIFDPYEATFGETGWQTRENYYDPSFTLTYKLTKNNTEEIITRTVSLADSQEITMKHPMAPLDLSIGTGVTMELIYRVKFIDYSMEKEDGDILVFNAKNEYLQAKEMGIANTAQYRSDNYYKEAYPELIKKYGEEVERLDKIENYSAVILALLQNAYNDQQAKIPVGYLQAENSIVDRLYNDLNTINNNLVVSLDKGYADQEEVLSNTYNNYNQYIRATMPQTILLHDLDYYLSNKYEIAEVLQDVNNTIDPIIYHLDRYKSQNLFLILSDMQTLCGDRKIGASKELTSLPTDVFYVAQYKEYLKEKQKNNFFTTRVTAFGKDYPVGYWLHKRKLTMAQFNKLENDASAVLSSYFHISPEDMELPELQEISIKKEIKDDKTQFLGYQIKGLDFYTDPESNMYWSEFYLIKAPIQPNKTVISYLRSGLIELNKEMGTVFNEESYTDFYKIKYYKNVSSSLQALINEANNKNNNQLSLGFFPANSYINIKKSYLEETLDSISKQGILPIDSQSTTKEVDSYLQESCEYYLELPEVLRELLVNIFIAYLTPRGIENRSFRDQYLEALTYSSYLDEHSTDFTEEEIKYIQTQIDNYRIRRNSEEWISTGIDSQLKQFSEGLIHWDNVRNSLGGTPNSELAKQMNEYIQELNKIIVAKKEVIQEYQQISTRLEQLNNDPDLSPSTNIREKLQTEIRIYGNGEKQLTDLQDNYVNQLLDLQTQSKVIAYQDFLKDYFLLIASKERFDTDSGYYEQIQSLRGYKNAMPKPTQAPQIQQQNITSKWYDFLKLLAQDYKIMR